MTIVVSSSLPVAPRREATLGELRAELLARLGYGAAGSQAGVQVALANSTLFASQTSLYWEFDWPDLRVYTTVQVGVDQFQVEYPADIERLRIEKLDTEFGGSVIQLKEGISSQHYSSMDQKSYPCRYDLLGWIELYPKANAVYPLRIWGIRTLAQFTQDGHFTTVHPDIVSLHALAVLKAHYKQPDAQIIATQLQNLLNKMKSKGWGRRIYSSPRDGREAPTDPYSLPPTGTIT